MKRPVVLITLVLLLVAAPASAYQESSSVTLEINPNAELLGVVYYLAFGNDTFVVDRGDYIREVEAYFGEYRNSRVVSIIQDYFSNARSISERDYYLMMLEYYLLLCSEPPELKPLTDLDYPWFEEVFLPALRSFAEDTNFMEFYRSHQNYYEEDLSIYRRALSLLPPDDFMAEQAGVSNVRYVFLHPYLVAVHGHSFSPELNGITYWGAGGMIPLVRRIPQRTFWSYKTARDTMFGLPLNRDVINSSYLDELIYLGFIYHELGHDATMPALNTNLRDYEYLQDAIEEDMPYLARYDMHFWNPAGMIYEGFADAWEDYALSHVDGNYSLLAMYMQKAWGEFWMESLLYSLQDCALGVSTRSYPNLTACVPEALKSLKKLASPENVSIVYENEVPVTPLRAFDRAAQAGKVIIVYGTQNPDKSGVEYDKATAEMIAENLRNFYSQWPGHVEVLVKADREVTKEDLKENLVLIGGPVANALVKSFEGQFPFKFVQVSGDWKLAYACNISNSCTTYRPVFFTITNESVKRSTYLLTDNASVILTVRNPFNPENYVTWIAGENRELTRLYTNPTYYLSSYEVYDGKEIQIGFYVQPLSS